MDFKKPAINEGSSAVSAESARIEQSMCAGAHTNYNYYETSGLSGRISITVGFFILQA